MIGVITAEVLALSVTSASLTVKVVVPTVAIVYVPSFDAVPDITIVPPTKYVSVVKLPVRVIVFVPEVNCKPVDQLVTSTFTGMIETATNLLSVASYPIERHLDFGSPEPFDHDTPSVPYLT